MRAHRRRHNTGTQYLLASLVTLVLGAGVMGFGFYIIKKAENSVVKYETIAIKKDK